MAKLLMAGTTQSPLNSQQLALILAQQATAESAIDRRSKAFKKVIDEVQEWKEEAERQRERSKYLELDVSRTDAYLAKTRQLLTQEQHKNAELKAELEESKKREKSIREKHLEEEKERGQPPSHPAREIKKAQRRLQKKSGEEEPSSPEPQGQPRKAVTFQSERCGVSFEQHELLINEAMLLKQELYKLTREKGLDVDKVLDAARFEKIIKKLQQDIQDKADENDLLLERIDELCSKDDGLASQVVELKFKNDKLQKKLNIGQVMIDTLSKRCEELKDEVEMSGQHRPEGGHPVDDSKVFVPIKSQEKEGSAEKDESATQGKDMVDGQFSYQKYEQQNQRLEKEIQLLDAQLKQLTLSNKQIFKERQEAERQREIYEQRYNKLMETLQDVQQKQRQCSNCRSLEQEIAKLKRELMDLKDINELVRAQMKLYEEDLRQEQQEAANQKQRNNFHIEQWKKNCQRMGQQVDLLTEDLKKEREKRQKLELELSKLPKYASSRSTKSLAPNFSRRCVPLGPRSSPWQEGFRSSDLPGEVVVDGPGEDLPDVGDKSDSMGEFHSSTSTLTSFSRDPSNSSMTSSFSLGEKPLECPRCKREYPANQMMEFQVHVNKCIDSS